MKKKFTTILAAASVSFVVAAGACAPAGPLSGNSDSGETTAGSYVVNIYDVDDELLASKTLDASADGNVWDALKDNFDVAYSESEYGPYISSINGQITDSNWYVAILENGAYASGGVTTLHADDGDVFDFRMECWNTVESGAGTLDSYDVLVDKAVYGYAKTYMKDLIASDTDYAGGNYWTYMAVYMMSACGYDLSVFNASAAGEALKNSLKNADLSALSGADYGKYFYTARALGLDLSDFKSAYANFIDDSLSGPYSEYVMPFAMSPAKYFELSSDTLQTLIDTDYLAGTEWGTDGLVWQIASLQLWEKYTPDILQSLPLSDQGNGASTALLLLPYAAFGLSPRTESSDLIRVLFDGYYDREANLLRWSADDSQIQPSTCQIYASLMAYKACRDMGKAVNLFA